jgi:multiple sugar transport system ATP-binding protein
VADFIGSPPMSFLRFEGVVRAGDCTVRVNGATLDIPQQHEEATGQLALGLRPEHVRLADDSPLRGRVFGAEYLGTTQIVTVNTPHGQIKARLPSSISVGIGDNVGLALRAERLVVFDAVSGRALRSALHDGEIDG